MFSPIVSPKHLSHEPIFNHFVGKYEDDRFKNTSQDVKDLMEYVVNKDLGCPVAASYSGIGSDVSNGFVQFICDNPFQFLELNTYLVEIMDMFPQKDRPCINIRSKSLPPELETDYDKQFITVMFRTPKFRNRDHARQWWGSLSHNVQSYSSQQ